MKKFLMISLVVVLLGFFASGCSSSVDEAKSKAVQEQEEHDHEGHDHEGHDH
jgi:protein involved in sex pheromone biosynthesis